MTAPREQRPVKAARFQNGMLMVFDEKGHQVPDYQGIADEVLPRLLKDFPNCTVEDAIWRR